MQLVEIAGLALVTVGYLLLAAASLVTFLGHLGPP